MSAQKYMQWSCSSDQEDEKNQQNSIFKDLSYDQIKLRLRRSGSSLRAVARELGVSHTAVVDVAKKERSSARISKALARTLNISLDQSCTSNPKEGQK